MPELRRFLESLGFVGAGQEGMHVKIRRVVNGSRQTLTVPLHHELAPGTCRGIHTLHRFFSTHD